MLRVIARVLRFYFSLLFVYLLCCFIAGPKNAVPWFVFVSLTLLGFTACGMIIQHRQKRAIQPGNTWAFSSPVNQVDSTAVCNSACSVQRDPGQLPMSDVGHGCFLQLDAGAQRCEILGLQ